MKKWLASRVMPSHRESVHPSASPAPVDSSTSKMATTALILARGGSKSVPKKNIKPLNGVPLMVYNIRACIESKVFDAVVVSTDADDIAEVARNAGATVHKRSEASASDTASSESGIQDYLDQHPECTICCLVQATSPLTTKEDFSKGFELFKKEEADSLVTVVRFHRFMWKVDPVTKVAEAKNYVPAKRPRRQDWDGEMVENGAFYFFKRSLFDETKCRLGGKMVSLIRDVCA